jgi:alkaline phosphatase
MLMALEENFGIGGEGAPIELTPKEIERFKKVFMGLDLSQEGDYGDYSPLTYISTQLLSNRSGLGWTSKSHTGVSVPVYALGLNGAAFSGYSDNTDIPRIIWETIE